MSDPIPYNLISKNLCGESSQQEDLELAQWLASNQIHLEIFEECVSVMADGMCTVDSDEVELRLKRISMTKKNFQAAWLIAACLVFIVVIFATLLIRDKDADIQPINHIELPDGSEVWLNSRSQVYFDTSDFEKDRLIRVEGEAIVRVVKQENPFLVLYGSGVVARLEHGEISIHAYHGQYHQTVVVSDGVVAFTDSRGITLEASSDYEVVAATDYGILSSSINRNLNFMSWMTGIYAFDEMPLYYAIAEISPGTSLAALGDINRDQVISGVFRLGNNDPLQAFLAIMKQNASPNIKKAKV